jgi:hypothetical protein
VQPAKSAAEKGKNICHRDRRVSSKIGAARSGFELQQPVAEIDLPEDRSGIPGTSPGAF